MSEMSLLDWEDFNTELASPFVKCYLNQKKVVSYTRHFFEEYKLTQFFISKHNRGLQLGASRGEYLEELHKIKQWDVLAYDYSHASKQILEEKSVPCRQIDLEQIANHSSDVAIIGQLQSDLKEPLHLFAVRILQYLSPQALQVLLFVLMDSAQPDTTFFIVGCVDNHPREDALKKNYIASFFAPRTDMQILNHRFSEENSSPDLDNDEIFVARKLK